MSDFLEARSSDGLRVLEAELADHDPDTWIRRARERGAALLWLHTNEDLAAFGFRRFPGYVRMRAGTAPRGERLPRLKPADFATTQDNAFRGLWGHKLVPADSEPASGALVLGLYGDGEPIGLCTVFPEDRLVDGPGVLPGHREPAAYVRLLLGACAELGGGDVDLDSWGDDPAVIRAYEALGFDVVERVTGWQLELTEDGHVR